MKHVSLGIPLMLSMAGTIGCLAVGGKGAHVGFGALFTALSLVHAYQHRKAMTAQMKKHTPAKALTAHLPQLPAVPHPQLPAMPHQLPTVPHHLPHPKSALPAHTRVAFFMPGRIRLYCRKLQANEGYKKVLWSELGGFRKIGQLEMNSLTGSVLITYDPDLAADEAALQPFLKAAAKKVAKKKVACI